MPHLNIEISDELLQAIRIACAKRRVRQKAWVVELLTEGSRVSSRGNDISVQGTTDAGGTGGKSALGQAVQGGTPDASESAGEHAVRGIEQPAPTKIKIPEPKPVRLATKYDGTPDTCLRCRVQLVVLNDSKTQCPNCREMFRRMV